MDPYLAWTNVRDDFRYAARSVRKSLGLFSFAALMIGLGIGACTAVFSVMRPLMLEPLPFADAERLVWIDNAGDPEHGMSAITSRTSNLRDFRELSRSFEGLTGFFAFYDRYGETLQPRAGGEPERIGTVGVAGDFLEVLGVTLLHGRNFDAAESVDDGRAAVILEHDFWARRFGADPNVVGTKIVLDGEPHAVVGVLPPSFDFASIFGPGTSVDALRPFPISDRTDRYGNTLTMLGRLQAGTSIEAAQAELDTIVASLQEADPERWGLGAVVRGMQERVAAPHRSALWLSAAAAGVVMLIVCVNLSSLLLAQGARRTEEMAVRGALGAPRGRLVRQLLFESLLVSGAGAAVGLGLAVAATRFIVSRPGLDLPLLEVVRVDPVALGLATLLAMVVGVGVGLLPALRLVRRGAGAFRGGARGASAGRSAGRLRSGLVVAEVALACTLIVFGGLLLRSFQRVLDVDLGFQPERLTAWSVVPGRSWETFEELTGYHEELVASVMATPGVESVTLIDAKPFGVNRTWGIRKAGEDKVSATLHPHMVDSRYFETMGIRLVQGRTFTMDDRRTGDDSEESNATQGPLSMILNESAARELFRGDDPIGRTLFLGTSEAQVVGVVRDVRHLNLEQGGGLQMYFPYSQLGDFSSLEMIVRSTLPPSTLEPAVRAVMERHDPMLPRGEAEAMTATIERTISPRRFTLQRLGAFAAVALLLAALGIYGMLAVFVRERRREIGIRMTLGETPGEVVTRLLARALTLAGLGLGIGAAASLAATHWAGSISSLLFGVEATDPATFVTMAALLLLVALVAAALPAWRAARTDIVRVLSVR